MTKLIRAEDAPPVSRDYYNGWKDAAHGIRREMLDEVTRDRIVYDLLSVAERMNVAALPAVAAPGVRVDEYVVRRLTDAMIAAQESAARAYEQDAPFKPSDFLAKVTASDIAAVLAALEPTEPQAPTPQAEAVEASSVVCPCGTDVTDLDGHLVHDDDCPESWRAQATIRKSQTVAPHTEAHEEQLGVWADELIADLVLNGLMDLVDHEYDTKVQTRRTMIDALKQANQAKVPQAEAVEALVKAVEFYRDGFQRKTKRSKTGIVLSVEYTPTEALLDDCGNRAIDAIAALRKEGGE